MSKQFASRGDMAAKKITFEKLGEGLYSYSAEGDPSSGVIVGDDAVMVIDARATPVEAQDLIKRIRRVTKKPIKYVVLTHYHAVRVMGASAYGAEYIVASEMTHDLIKERGKQDFKSEVERFPRLFHSVESVPGLTRPNLTFSDRMSIWLGKREVQLMHLGKGHTKGDIVAWLPKEKVCFSGDLVENGATPYTGDAYLGEWIQTLETLRALKPRKLVPGRGDALKTPAKVDEAIKNTQGFLKAVRRNVGKGIENKKDLRGVFEATHRAMKRKYGDWVIFDHCMPFDVSRCYDEMTGITDPRIWTAKRDIEMWKALAG